MKSQRSSARRAPELEGLVLPGDEGVEVHNRRLLDLWAAKSVVDWLARLEVQNAAK